MASQRERAREFRETYTCDTCKGPWQEGGVECESRMLEKFAAKELAARDAAIGGLVNAAQNLEQWDTMGRTVLVDFMRDLQKALAAYKKTEVQP